MLSGDCFYLVLVSHIHVSDHGFFFWPELYRLIKTLNKNFEKGIAPGEARTHGLQIMRLTRCLLRYGGTMYKSYYQKIRHILF